MLVHTNLSASFALDFTLWWIWRGLHQYGAAVSLRWKREEVTSQSWIVHQMRIYGRYLDLTTLISDWLTTDISWHSRKEPVTDLGLLTRVILCSRICFLSVWGVAINLHDCSATLNGNLCLCGRYLHRFSIALFFAHTPTLGTCLLC